MALQESDLSQFYGTENYYRHPLCRKLVYTDGVKYLAEKGGAYWLLDIIASYQNDKRITGNSMLREMQFWNLKVADNKGVVTCKADSNKKPAITQEIPFTDFPLPEIDIWVELGSLDGVNTVMVAMLKSER